MKKNYPYAFEIAVLVGDIIGEYTGESIPESEIGYIAIHFGGAMSRLQEQNQKEKDAYWFVRLVKEVPNY